MSDCTDGIGLFKNNYGMWKSCSWLDTEWKLRQNCGYRTYIQTALGESCRATCWAYNGCPPARSSTMPPTGRKSTRQPTFTRLAKSNAPLSSPTGTPTRNPASPRFIQPSMRPTKLLALPTQMPHPLPTITNRKISSLRPTYSPNRITSSLRPTHTPTRKFSSLRPTHSPNRKMLTLRPTRRPIRRKMSSLRPTHSPTPQVPLYYEDDTTMEQRSYHTNAPTKRGNTTLVGSVHKDQSSDGTKPIALSLGCAVAAIFTLILGIALFRKKRGQDGKKISKTDNQQPQGDRFRQRGKSDQIETNALGNGTLPIVTQEEQMRRDSNNKDSSTNEHKLRKAVPSHEDNVGINAIDEKLRDTEGSFGIFSFLSQSASLEPSGGSHSVSTVSSLTKDYNGSSIEASNVGRWKYPRLIKNPAEVALPKEATVINLRQDTETRRGMQTSSNLTSSTIDVLDTDDDNNNNGTAKSSPRFVSWLLPPSKQYDGKESSFFKSSSIEESHPVSYKDSHPISHHLSSTFGYSLSTDEHNPSQDDDEKTKDAKVWRLGSLMRPKRQETGVDDQKSYDIDSSTTTSGSITLNNTISSLQSESLLFVLMDEGRRFLNCTSTFDESSRRK